MQRIVVIGGGFAGLWTAAGAIRRLEQAGESAPDIRVTLIERQDYHNIRVRNYESDPRFTIPLDKLLPPIGVTWIQGEVTGIDPRQQTVQIAEMEQSQAIGYDRLVLAAGSHVVRPDIPGMEHAFDVDTNAGAQRLAQHLDQRPQSTDNGRYTAVIVGGGLTGIEAACDMPSRLQAIRDAAGDQDSVRVILVDAASHIGSDMGQQAREVIDQALSDLHVETMTSTEVSAIEAGRITFSDGQSLACQTLIWTAGMQASPLGAELGVPMDAQGRVPVNDQLQVQGLDHVYATGDSAWFEISPGHHNVMSCQHGRPMGRYAGHNVAADLLGKPLRSLRIDWYVTVMDLGPWGAVYTEGWDRQVVSTGAPAKQTKRTINQDRIYPPQNGDREAILAAAAPDIDAPPEKN